MLTEMILNNSNLKWVWKGNVCYSAPDHLDTEKGWFKVWEEKDFFLLLPYRMAPGRGETRDNNRSPKILKKSDGWEGVYEIKNKNNV